MPKTNYVPTLWGGAGWKFLHIVALSYPSEPTPVDKDNYKNFFLSMKSVLPCESCSENFKKHVEKFPIDNYLESPETLFDWIIKINNEVNKITNKSQIDAKTMKKKYDSGNVAPSNKMFYLYGIIGILSLVGVIYLMRKNKIKLI